MGTRQPYPRPIAGMSPLFYFRANRMPRGTNLIAASAVEFVEPIAGDVNLFGHGKDHQELFAM